jgi:hypothetical protein
MEERLIFFTQQEYTQVLDRQNARTRKLSQKEYEQILIDRGVRPGQAKMAAYKYRHHEKSRFATRKGSQEEYEKLLNDFCAAGSHLLIRSGVWRAWALALVRLIQPLTNIEGRKV